MQHSMLERARSVGGALLAGALRKPAARGADWSCSVTIGKSAEEIQRAWRDPHQLAAVMKHFARVEPRAEDRLHWAVPLPAGKELSWTTSITEDRPGEVIAWRGDPGAPFAHEGWLRFRAAPANLGTEVTLRMWFAAERSLVDLAMRTLAGTFLQNVPKALEESILRRFKSLCETGEIPTLERNPSARVSAPTERLAHAGPAVQLDPGSVS